MQIISRTVDESVRVGDLIVTVLEIQQDLVRLGINSPHATPSYWEETLYLDHQDDCYNFEPPLDLIDRNNAVTAL